MTRIDRAWDCEGSRAKAERFADAVNATWSTALPIVKVYIDVANNELRFVDEAAACEPPP